MKTFIKHVCRFAILVVILFSASIGFARTPGVTNNSILLGSTLCQSGPPAFAFKLFTTGAQAYFKKINDAGGVHGRKINMIFEDGRYNVATTIAATKLLIERSKVFCLFLESSSAATLALDPLLSQEKIPLVCPMACSGSLGFNKPKKYIFPFQTPYESHVRTLVHYIVKELGDTNPKISILYQDDEFGYDGLRGLKKAEKEYNFKSVAEVSFKRGSADFSSYALKLKRGSPDHVILHCLWRDGASALKEAYKMGWNPKFYGTTGMISNRIIKLAGKEASDGLISTGLSVDPMGKSPGAIEYRKDVKNYDPKFNVNSDYAIWGYGAAKVLVEGLQRVGKDLTREKLITALETLHDFDTGVTPAITYGPNVRRGGESVLLKKIIGGQHTVIGDWLKP